MHGMEVKQRSRTGEMMNTRQLGFFGLAALGLALAAPVQAAPDYVDGAFVVAQRDRDDEARRDKRDAGRDAGKDDRRSPRREAEREDPQGYGYGYERRHQKESEPEDPDSRPRGRR
jgi:hypothetical protein